ncbi:MarR family transcriptional regulator [Nitrosococcus wardiae]|uniref:MarR family transcriptional regulator n=1 Tax=Nitrosococcus wardiae TaxID=1814290 RepID=A0A4V1AW03_9GAMM|nr:MarR family transcriptional regulator [Nitrosococcus wardiae]QBQ54935.1 MarR family transcriptional regulator [Nitrosococcus wardiae]
MKRVLHVEISSLEKSLEQFGKALEQTMQGAELESFEGIGFESLAELLGTLTPKRWELIRRLKQEGPMTIYALAKMLGRDYKNVRLDVKALEEWGIIERDEVERVLVPWDEIDVRVPLAA